MKLLGQTVWKWLPRGCSISILKKHQWHCTTLHEMSGATCLKVNTQKLSTFNICIKCHEVILKSMKWQGRYFLLSFGFFLYMLLQFLSVCCCSCSNTTCWCLLLYVLSVSSSHAFKCLPAISAGTTGNTLTCTFSMLTVHFGILDSHLYISINK